MYKNYYEEIIDKLMNELVSDNNSETNKLLTDLDTNQKRISILSILDNNRGIFRDIFKIIKNNDVTKTEHIKRVVKMLREYVKVGDIEKKKFGEVMTPNSLVNEMLDTLPIDVWSNPNLKWLDPANGVGVFPAVIIERLMDGLKNVITDDEFRYKHIVENMIHVCELQPKNMFLHLCAFDPEDKYSLNVYTGNFLSDDFDKHAKNIWNVNKFDIIIGNPPYQKMDNGAKSSAQPIYNLFVEKSLKITNKLLFITPSRWFAGGKGLNNYRKMMMNRTDIVLIKHYDDASTFFGNSVEIKGGVSYFYIDNTYNGDCSFNNYKIKLNTFDIIVSNIKSYSILNKIIVQKNINHLYEPRSYFKISTNDTRLSFVNNDEKIKCYVSIHKGLIKFIDKKHIVNKDLTKFRIITPSAATKGGQGFGKIHILNPNECFSDSYISFYTKTLNEARILKSYLKTKFANFLLSLRKVSQTVKSDTCKWIPMVDLNQEWTDEKLYKHFNLTDDEINLIETH